MFSIFVTINVQAEHIEAFKEASLGDAHGSTRDEPGCFRFDINQDAEIPSRFYLYEVYQDEAAFQAHREQPHFLAWRERTAPWLDGELTKKVMSTVFPSADGWAKQKPGLLNW
jgi:autoinducer 2-degrading protein